MILRYVKPFFAKQAIFATKITGINYSMMQSYGGKSKGSKAPADPPKNNEPIVKIENSTNKKNRYISYYNYDEQKWLRYEARDNADIECSLAFRAAQQLLKYQNNEGAMNEEDLNNIFRGIAEGDKRIESRAAQLNLFYNLYKEDRIFTQKEQSRFMLHVLESEPLHNTKLD